MWGQKLQVLKNTPEDVPFPPLSQHFNPQSAQERMNFRKRLQLFTNPELYITNFHINYRKMIENMWKFKK